MSDALSKTTIAFHWIIAISILGLVPLGFYMRYTYNLELYYYHKSIGVLVLMLALARVIWRIREGWPTPDPEHKPWEKVSASAIHWILLISTVAIPISGIMYSGAGGFGVHIFDWNIIPPNPSPTNPSKMVPYNELVYKLGVFGHTKLIYIPLAAIALHTLGALKHHYIDKDNTLKRILYSKAGQ